MREAVSSQSADCDFSSGQSPGVGVRWLSQPRSPARPRGELRQPRAASPGEAAIDWESVCLPRGNADGHGRAGAQHLSGTSGPHVNGNSLQGCNS